MRSDIGELQLASIDSQSGGERAADFSALISKLRIPSRASWVVLRIRHENRFLLLTITAGGRQVMARRIESRRIDDDELRRFGLVCLVILLLTVLGYAWLGIVMKFEGYPDPNPPGIRWNPLAFKLRQYGHWSLFLFLIWAISVLFSHVWNRRVVMRIMCILLSVPVVLLPFLFFMAAMSPYTRGILMKLPEPSNLQQSSSSQSTSANTIAEPQPVILPGPSR
jgi:hypothetical protein